MTQVDAGSTAHQQGGDMSNSSLKIWEKGRCVQSSFHTVSQMTERSTESHLVKI
jgi:hypothetical protein